MNNAAEICNKYTVWSRMSERSPRGSVPQRIKAGTLTQFGVLDLALVSSVRQMNICLKYITVIYSVALLKLYLVMKLVLEYRVGSSPDFSSVHTLFF